jgi:hypothetical protein
MSALPSEIGRPADITQCPLGADSVAKGSKRRGVILSVKTQTSESGQ